MHDLSALLVNRRERDQRAFGAADAMYAPVVWRFHTYAVDVSDAARAYMGAMMALPAWREWRDAARREPWVLEHDEVDWPTVLRE